MISNYLKKMAQILLGFFFYYLLPKKTIVLIMCCARSGSTLLKALLAEAPDVSHLPEINFRRYLSNKYHLCFASHRFSTKRIIVFKRPHWFNNVKDKLSIPDSKNIKVIFLVRDVYDTVVSLEKRTKVNCLNIGKKELVEFWCNANEMIMNTVAHIKQNVYFVRYEDLLKNAEDVTKMLFKFIGSCRRDGTNTYLR